MRRHAVLLSLLSVVLLPTPSLAQVRGQVRLSRGIDHRSTVSKEQRRHLAGSAAPTEDRASRQLHGQRLSLTTPRSRRSLQRVGTGVTRPATGNAAARSPSMSARMPEPG